MVQHQEQFGVVSCSKTFSDDNFQVQDQTRKLPNTGKLFYHLNPPPFFFKFSSMNGYKQYPLFLFFFVFFRSYIPHTVGSNLKLAQFFFSFFVFPALLLHCAWKTGTPQHPWECECFTSTLLNDSQLQCQGNHWNHWLILTAQCYIFENQKKLYMDLQKALH